MICRKIKARLIRAASKVRELTFRRFPSPLYKTKWFNFDIVLMYRANIAMSIKIFLQLFFMMGGTMNY